MRYVKRNDGQSKGVSVERETGRVAMPRALSRALTRAPVFPPPPMMRIVPCDMILTSTIFHRLGVTDRHG